jgi:hypothetical protein
LKFRIFLQPPQKGGAVKRGFRPPFFFPLFPLFILPQEGLPPFPQGRGDKGMGNSKSLSISLYERERLPDHLYRLNLKPLFTLVYHIASIF